MKARTTESEQRDPQTYAIIGACMEVHRQLGHGFSESVYQEALEEEFKLRSIPYQREVRLRIYYKGKELKCKFDVDFICFGDIVVELKALRQLSGTETSQVINYLKAANIRRGLMVNFGGPWLKYERFVHDPSSVSSASSVDGSEPEGPE